MSHFFQRLASAAIQPSTTLKLRPLSGSVYAPSRLPFAEEVVVNPGADRADAPMPPRREAPVRSANQPLLSAPPPPPARDEKSVAVSPKSAEASSFISPANRREDLVQPETPAAETPLERATIRPLRSFTASPMAEKGARIEIENQADSTTRILPDRPPREQLLPSAEQALAPSPPNPPSTSAPIAARTAPLLPPQLPAAGDQRLKTPEPSRRAVLPGGEGEEINIHIGRIEVAAVSPPPARPAAAAAPRKSLNLEEYLRRGNRRAG